MAFDFYKGTQLDFMEVRTDPQIKSVGRSLETRVACRGRNHCLSGESWHRGSMQSPPVLTLV